ncbi:MAG: hypothetical protein WAX84_01405, partial [Leptotrichiaceae bacterium]
VIFGIIIKRPELWFAFFIGSVASIINSYLLLSVIHKTVYYQTHGKAGMYIEYIKRIAIFILSLYLVVLVTRKFFPNILLNNIVAAGIGILNFKISLFISKLLEYREHKKKGDGN